MKFWTIAACLATAVLTLTSRSPAQTSAFTYQGQLLNNGVPANGYFNLKFDVFAVETGGSSLAGSISDPSVEVNDGVFTVILNFGSAVFNGTDRWLAIAVRPAGETSPHTNLAPRQLITPTPYSIRAATAGTVTGPISDSQLSANIIRLDNSIAGASMLKLQADFPILTLETNTADNAADFRLVRQGQIKWSMSMGPTSGDNLSFTSAGGKSVTLSQEGYFGIGNGLPRAPLEVTSSDSPAVLRIQSQASFGSGKIEFWSDPVRSASEWHPASIRSTNNGDFTGGLSFLVNGTGFSSATSELEVMRLVNGNVGIGISTPLTRMHIVAPHTDDNLGNVLVESDVNPSLVVRSPAVAAQFMAWENLGLRIGTRYSPTGTGHLFFTTDDNVQMTVREDGKIGIGTTTPESQLAVHNGGSSSPIGAISADVGTFETGANAVASYFLRFRDVGGGTTPFVVRGDGNVGIGTASPSQKLTVVGSIGLAGQGELIFPDGSVLRSANQMAIPVQVQFTTNGSWQVPPGVARVRFRVVGGGGGGSTRNAGGGGGGGGGFGQFVVINAVAGEFFDFTIGAGGGSGNPGTAGGQSTIVRRAGAVPLVTANGGAPGNNTNGGAGGSAAGQLVVFGDSGEAWNPANGDIGLGGGPGSSNGDFPFGFPGDGRPYGTGGNGRYNEDGETDSAEPGFPGYLLIEY